MKLERRGKSRVLFVCTKPDGWGGSEFLWSQTAVELLGLGYSVSVFVEDRRPEPRIFQQIEDAGGRVIRNNATQKPAPPASLPRRMKRWLLRKVVKWRPRRFSVSGVLESEKPDLVVVAQQSCIEGVDWMSECLQRNLTYATLAQSCHDMLFHSDNFADQIEPAFMGAKRSFFVSQDNRVKLETFFAKKFPSPQVVRNPFKVDYSAPLPWPNDSDGLHLANVARLHIPSKGQDILLRVLAMQKWRDRKIVVHFFGTGENERRLKQFALACDLLNVVFHGHVDDISEVWRQHHALLLPSRHEGLPIALVEAMLCGRPAVVTDIVGNPEVMIDSETGFIATAPTVQAFDHAMEKLWNERHRLHELGDNAARHIRTLVPEDPVGTFAEQLLSIVEDQS